MQGLPIATEMQRMDVKQTPLPISQIAAHVVKFAVPATSLEPVREVFVMVPAILALQIATTTSKQTDVKSISTRTQAIVEVAVLPVARSTLLLHALREHAPEPAQLVLPIATTISRQMVAKSILQAPMCLIAVVVVLPAARATSREPVQEVFAAVPVIPVLLIATTTNKPMDAKSISIQVLLTVVAAEVCAVSTTWLQIAAPPEPAAVHAQLVLPIATTISR